MTTTEKLRKIFSDNSNKRICVLGTTCTGKSTILKNNNLGKDMDEEIFPLLTKEETEYVCQTPWTKEIGDKMNELVREKLHIVTGTPLFGTVLLDCDLIVYLHIDDKLLFERTKLRNTNFDNAKSMQKKIEEEIKNSNVPAITIEIEE